MFCFTHYHPPKIDWCDGPSWVDDDGGQPLGKLKVDSVIDRSKVCCCCCCGVLMAIVVRLKKKIGLIAFLFPLDWSKFSLQGQNFGELLTLFWGFSLVFFLF